MKAPFCMMMCPLKKAFHLFTVVLLFTKIVVMLLMAVTFVVFTVLPTLLVCFFWMMKKMRRAHMGKHGKMHMRMHAPRRFKP
jgi:hypothetical protein